VAFFYVLVGLRPTRKETSGRDDRVINVNEHHPLEKKLAEEMIGLLM